MNYRIEYAVESVNMANIDKVEHCEYKFEADTKEKVTELFIKNTIPAKKHILVAHSEPHFGIAPLPDEDW